MRIAALHTYTDCWNKMASMEAVGHEVVRIQYDDRPHDRHGEIVEAARAAAPDLIVYIGAVEQYHGRPCLRPETHLRIREIAPYVHMCNDAADDPWWGLIELYRQTDCFSLQVSIDGSTNSPLWGKPDALTLLTPIDHRPFQPIPWGEREIGFGMVGGIGHTDRHATISEMISRGAIDFRQGPIGRSYEDMAGIMCNTRITFNSPRTGTNRFKHVKGRVVEAGFAGCLLLEEAGAPTSSWFERGEDYLEYRDAGEAMELAREFGGEAGRLVAERFHQRVTTDHHPAVFWSRVVEAARARDRR